MDTKAIKNTDMAQKKSFGEIWASLTDEQAEYLKEYIDRQRERAVSEYRAKAELCPKE